MLREEETRTVDGDGHALGEDVAIRTNKGRDLGERVCLQELGSRLSGVNLDNIEVKAIGLRNREDGGGAGVELCDKDHLLVIMHE